jgi:hypothetical protein
MKERVTYTNISAEEALFDAEALLDIYGDITADGFILDIKILSLKKHSGDTLADQPTDATPEALSETIQRAIADRYCIEKTGEAYP